MAIATENFKIVCKNINTGCFNLQGNHLNTNLASNLSTVSKMTVDRSCNQSSRMDLFFPCSGYPCGRIFVHLSSWWLKIEWLSWRACIFCQLQVTYCSQAQPPGLEGKDSLVCHSLFRGILHQLLLTKKGAILKNLDLSLVMRFFICLVWLLVN